MAKKIAEQLIETLVESGVERIYAVTGDSLNEVNEAVRKSNKIQWIHVRHEETGAYAAAAEAQLTGRIGCCAGSSGPGHVHLINGLYDAQRSGAPVIAIASTIPSGEFGTEYFQETNTIKLFNDCSYYNEVATTPGQFPRMLQSAIQTAITRKGVAVVGLPGDLAKASSVSVDSSVKNYPAPPEVCPAEEDLIQLAEFQLARRQRRKMGEIEPHTVRIHQLTGLLDMCAQHPAQRRLQQVRRRVVTHGRMAHIIVDRGGEYIAYPQIAGFLHTDMRDHTVMTFDGVFYIKLCAVANQRADIAHLSAAFRVERGHIQHNSRFFARRNGFDQLVIHNNRGHDRLVTQLLIADKFAGGQLFQHTRAVFPCVGIVVALRVAGAFTLLGHQIRKRLLVHRQALFFQNILGQVQRESIGIVQLKRILTGQHRALQMRQHIIQQRQTAVDGFGEGILLHLNQFGDEIFLFRQLRIRAQVLFDHRFAHFIQERLVDAEQTTVARGAAQQTAQHIAATLVGGHHAVADHKGGGTDMVGDNPQRHIGLGIVAVMYARDAADMFHDILDRIHFKQVVHPLHDAGQTLQSHTGVDVGMIQRRIVARAVAVELGEHEVPKFDIAVAVAAHAAGGRTAAVFLAAVKIQFGAGAAGTGAVLPEVVLFAQTNNMVGSYAHLTRPDIKRFVIIFINADPNPVDRQLQHLGAELPRPRGGFVFEIVAEAEVAEHFKIGTVARGFAHPLDIGGADTFLTGSNPFAGRGDLAGEEFFHRCHTGVDQQKGFVPFGNQPEAGQTQMSLAFKKRQIFFP